MDFRDLLGVPQAEGPFSTSMYITKACSQDALGIPASSWSDSQSDGGFLLEFVGKIATTKWPLKTSNL